MVVNRTDSNTGDDETAGTHLLQISDCRVIVEHAIQRWSELECQEPRQRSPMLSRGEEIPHHSQVPHHPDDGVIEEANSLTSVHWMLGSVEDG